MIFALRKFFILTFVFSLTAGAIFSVALPEYSLAFDTGSITQVNPPGPGNSPIISVEGGSNSILGLLRVALKWFAIAFWIFAAGFIFYAAYLYLFGGATGDIKKANSALRWAIVAIIVGIVAYGLPDFITNVLKGI